MFSALFRYLYMFYKDKTHLSPFFDSARNPGAAQIKVLRSILEKNQGTVFGKAHGFEAIKNIDQFREAVAIQTYDSLQQFIERQETEGNILTADPIIMFAQTSGTTGRAKMLPMSPATITRIKREQEMLSAWQYKLCPQAFTGKALGIVSSALEGRTEAGTPVGSVSGYMYQNMPAVFRKRYVLPYEVFEIEDYDLKYLVIARLALQEENITYLGSANPSTFIRLLEVINENSELLIKELETGQMSATGRLAPAIRGVVARHLKPNAIQASKLRKASKRNRIRYKDLWPNISLLMTWTCGSCGIPLSALKKTLPAHALVVDPGYLSSEFRGSFTCDKHQNGLPMLTSCFYEFIERDAWENGEMALHTIEELKEGSEYYLLVTTDTGLYRYFMNDIVKVFGFMHKTPLLRFGHKGNGVTNITGEKVTESHILSLMQSMEYLYDFDSRYFLCLANEERSVYQLFVEPEGSDISSVTEFSTKADMKLREFNIEYDQKRASGRLHSLETFILKSGTADAIKRYFVSRGQRENQFKPPILMLSRECLFPIQEAVG